MHTLPPGTPLHEVLARYPAGFTVMASGRLAKVVFGSSHFSHVARAHPIAPPDGGYHVIEMVDEQLEPSVVPPPDAKPVPLEVVPPFNEDTHW